MNKHVFEKIAKLGKTELSEVNVELASILRLNEYKKWLEEDKQKYLQLRQAIEKIQKEYFMLSGNSVFIETDLENFAKKVEELSLDPNISTDYKESKKILDEMQKQNKFFGDFKKKHNL
jgi:hypothetical protein